jgi:hypothetical protein
VELLKSDLARYLLVIIDRNYVASKLLYEHIIFFSVKVVPRKIDKLTTKDGHTIFLLMEDGISKLTIRWKLSSFLRLDEASISLNGPNLSSRTLVEQKSVMFDKHQEHAGKPALPIISPFSFGRFGEL